MTVFVTGATSGFGQATARKFIEDGAKVIGTGRRQDRLTQLRAELGTNFLPLAFDVSKHQELEKAARGLPDGFQDVDVLLNNAGGAIGLDPAQSANLADWEEMIDTNVKGLVYCTHFFLPGHGPTQTGTHHQHWFRRSRVSLPRRQCLRRCQGICPSVQL